MKKINILALLVFAFSVANAQSINSGSTVAQTKGEPLVNGIPYSQYKAQQDAIKNKVAAKQETAPSLRVIAISADDLKNLRKEEKQQPVTTAPVSPAKAGTAQYADKTIPGTVFQATGATISTATTEPATLQSAASPVKATQTQVAKPATSKQGSGN